METVFLVCLVFGGLFTLVSVALGFAGSALHGLHADTGAHGVSAGHAGQGGHGHGGAGPHGHDAQHGDAQHAGLPLLNVSSLLAFLTWFGAAGYLLLRFAAWPVIAALPAAVVAGSGGSLVIALFLRKVLAGEREMIPADYRMEGTLARVTVSIPATGVGEIVFTKAGSRRGEAARSLSGRPIPRDTEVVVIDYQRGVAAVQPWDEFIARPRGGEIEDPASQVEPDALGRRLPPAGGGA